MQWIWRYAIYCTQMSPFWGQSQKGKKSAARWAGLAVPFSWWLKKGLTWMYCIFFKSLQKKRSENHFQMWYLSIQQTYRDQLNCSMSKIENNFPFFFQKKKFRSPSPEPIYSSDGKRLNTRDYRKRKELEESRHGSIQRMLAINPEYKPPPDYKYVDFYFI